MAYRKPVIFNSEQVSLLSAKLEELLSHQPEQVSAKVTRAAFIKENAKTIKKLLSMGYTTTQLAEHLKTIEPSFSAQMFRVNRWSSKSKAPKSSTASSKETPKQQAAVQQTSDTLRQAKPIQPVFEER